MKNNVLIVVDMQNDFIDGVLGTKEAQTIVKPMVDFIKDWTGPIILTKDTHNENYLNTQEGSYLPIPHCTVHTHGWNIKGEILDATDESCEYWDVVYKDRFCGGKNLIESLSEIKDNFGTIESITLIGVCTDICVISNALFLKYVYPETQIYVKSSLCAGVTPEKHAAALEVMRSCQIEVID